MNSQQLREQFMEDRGGIFNPEQRVEVNINGVWVPGTIASIANYTVRNTATGRNVNRRPDQVRTLNYGTGENTNIIPGSQIVFQRSSNWLNEIPGTLVSKNYLVEIDHDRIETVPHTRLRRPGQQDIQAPLPRPRNPPRAPAQPQPIIGVAFEIHNAFPELNFKKFMTIIKKDNNGASNFKDQRYPLQPLITYINTDTSTTLDATEKTNLTRDLNGEIKIRLNMYLSEHPKTKNSVMEMTQFVMSQGPDYKDPYIRFLVFDCMNAYGPGGASCTKGIFERVFLINKSVLIPLCSNDTSSASSTSTCKEVYRELLGCFYPDMDLNALFGEWYAINNLEEGSTSPLANASEEERKEDFRKFVLRKVPRADPTAINSYIEKNENTFKTLLIGGRRSNKKTIKKRKNKTVKKRSGSKKRRSSKRR